MAHWLDRGRVDIYRDLLAYVCLFRLGGLLEGIHTLLIHNIWQGIGVIAIIIGIVEGSAEASGCAPR